VTEGASSVANDFDLIILLGGDGFLLGSLGRLNYPDIPVLGVNFGSVGFLMHKRACLDTLVAAISQWRAREELHSVLEASVTLEDGSTEVVRAVNDFVLERLTGQSIRVRIFLDDRLFNRFSGDGLVLATAAGSTAYNLAAGGPVVHPEIRGMVVTPLHPHRAAPFHSLQFTLVLPLASRLRIETDDVGKRPIRLLADGRPVGNVSTIEIVESTRKVRLVRLEEHLFFRTLSRKFIGEADGDGEA